MILNYIHWNLDPEIINIFGFSLRYYSLLFVTGLISTIIILKWIFKKEGLPPENLDKLTMYAIIGMVLGMRLGHCLFYEPSYYLAHPLEIILPVKFLDNGGIEFTGFQGLASHGGVLGFLIALYFYSRKTKQPMLATLDLIAVAAGLLGVFIRLGNFMNSEIIGIPTTKPWGVIFERIDNIPRHPAQLYESISYLIIFTVMIFLYIKAKEKFKNGFFFGLVLILIFIARFIIEFVKENQVGFEDEMSINMGQILSLPYIAIGIGFLIYGLRSWKSTTHNNVYNL
ncbi:prolipoprotein diacylglyceryl transferase [Croceitalea marina]|uniref:Phosphatidylglycerol--prolipoprotein diacylglyceryl transferase n=1 Tax=Croceitalea marina TaxID=1775166 RepID=A0ABW5N2K3_9FLAO